MLSIPSKIAEGVICETLDKHLEKTIQKNQCSFRKGLSTESLLLYLTETWKHYIEKGKVIGAIFIDFKKAFDSVDHKVLENKLRACGIEGNMLKFLKSYLSERSQFVEVNGKRSKLLIIEYDVPQGSLFGPRLYSIYVNDFAATIKGGEVHLYEDDTTAFVIGNNTHEVVELLNILFDELNEWWNINRLTIHTGKIEAMIIQQHPFIGPLLPVKCGDKIIKYASCTELLGIILDHKLSWNLQIRKVCKQYGAKIKQLKKMRYLPTPLLEEIYFKTVVPQISYCISVWGSCSIPLFNELEKQHPRASRVVHKMPENIKEHDILKLANWQDLSYIYKRRISTEMYKVVQGEESRLRHLFAVTNTRKGKMVE